MKKTLLIAAAALVSASAFAQTVSSANIVGYVKTDTPADDGFKMIAALPFGIGTNETVDIQDVIANTDVLTASTTYENADKLMIFDGSYTSYGLYAGTSSNYWMAAGAAWVVAPLPKTPAAVSLNRGDAIWIKAGSGAPSTNVVMSGDVYADGTISVDVSAGFNMIAYPYSSTINLTDLTITNATASTVFDDADKIMIFDGSYTTYGLYAGTSSNYWMAAGAAWVVAPLPKIPASVDVDLGSGFWFRTDTSKTIGFTQNYTLD